MKCYIAVTLALLTGPVVIVLFLFFREDSGGRDLKWFMGTELVVIPEFLVMDLEIQNLEIYR